MEFNEDIDVKKEENFKKNFFWNMIGMTFNSFNSLFYMVIVTRLNGSEAAGIFTLAFSIACLVFYIGSYAGRVYQVTSKNNWLNDSDYIQQRIISCIFLVFISVLYCLFMGYKGDKFIIVILLCILKGLEAFSDVLYGIVHKNGQLYLAGLSLTIKSIISLILFLVIDFLTHNIIIATCMMIGVWIIIMIFFDIPNCKFTEISIKKFNLKNISFLFRDGFFVFLINFLSVYIANATKYASDGILTNSQIAVFGILVMPATFVSLAVQYFIQPYLTKFRNACKERNVSKFNKLVLNLYYLTIFIGIICVVGGYLLGAQVLELIYAINFSKYKVHLVIVILGAILYSLSIILSAALTTVRYNFMQFIIYIITSLFALLFSSPIIQKFGIDGAILSYLLIMFVQFIAYGLTYCFICFNKSLFKKCFD